MAARPETQPLPLQKDDISDSLNDVSNKFTLDMSDSESSPFDPIEPQFDAHTKTDQWDMRRMGKRQLFRRTYGLPSAFSFTFVLTAGWVVTFLSTSDVLLDGGISGMFWSYFWTMLGMSSLILSTAEMASIAPTAGGEYHWVSEFAPSSVEKILSYVTGWMELVAWVLGAATYCCICGTVIQGIILSNYPTFEPQGYQVTLIILAVASISVFFNIYAARSMPFLQVALLIMHIFAFFAILIVLWILCPLNSAHDVFTNFSQQGGWSTMAMAVQVGQMDAVFAVFGGDASAHMSEEITDASRNVPRALIGGFWLSNFMALIATLTLCFTVYDIEAALADDTGYAFLWILRTSLPTGGRTFLMALMLILFIAATITCITCASRMMFALARDGGLPFSPWISHVSTTRSIPAHAVVCTCGTICVVAIIRVGSGAAFDALASLAASAEMFCYVMALGAFWFKRIRQPDQLPPASWQMGKVGVLINFVNLIYGMYVLFFSFWPSLAKPTPSTFNWSIVLFGVTIMLSLVSYFVQGRYTYKSPASQVLLAKGRR